MQYIVVTVERHGRKGTQHMHPKILPDWTTDGVMYHTHAVTAHTNSPSLIDEGRKDTKRVSVAR